MEKFMLQKEEGLCPSGNKSFRLLQDTILLFFQNKSCDISLLYMYKTANFYLISQ